MLSFLRKHQRIFFVFITVAIVVSFSFFGTYSTMGQQEAAPDKEIVKGVCGSPIMQQELAALCRLIEHSPFDGYAGEKGGIPNFLNDGVIEKDFMASGLAVMLAKRYFEELKPDLDLKVKKIHHFRPYTHPKSAQISAEGTWARFSPSLLEHYRALKEKSDQATTETLAMMCQLYLDQAMVSPEMLKQILLMQQNQQGVPADPVLVNADLSLFGFKSVEDWFGPRFAPLVAQFILNAAQIAEKSGYAIKTEEVRADLFQNIHRGYQQISRNATLNPEEADQYYYQKMRALGLDESTLVSTWKKVMLFRRLFDDGSGSVLIDALAYQQFDRFAKENVRLSLYQLPQALQLSDFRSLLKFQLYLESVAQDSSRLRTDLAIPRIATIEQIERRAPEIVERQLEIEYSTVSKDELCRGISVRETWEWEASDANWEKLKANFPEIATGSAATREQRLALLDKLDEKQRVKVDQFARVKMVEGHDAKIKLALEMAPVKTAALGLRKKGGVFPFAGVKEGSDLVPLLENAALKEEAPNAANDRLNFYSADKENYYRIQVLQRSDGKKVLTFEEAVKDGTLDKMLDKRLEDSYADARRKDSQSFQQTNGQWKPFKEVKDQIGKVLYADLLKSIEEQYRNQFGVLPGKAGELPLGFYSNARMVAYMNEAQKHLQANPDDAAWVKTQDVGVDLFSQWLLVKTDKVMERCTQVSFSKDELFTLAANQWSPVKIGERGSLAFYFVKEKGVSKLPPLESMNQGHQILSFDAKRDMMLQMLQKIHQNKAIDLSYVAETR